MKLFVQQPDPRIPLSILMLVLAGNARLNAQCRRAAACLTGDGMAPDCELERASEEPERWDGMS